MHYSGRGLPRVAGGAARTSAPVCAFSRHRTAWLRLACDRHIQCRGIRVPVHRRREMVARFLHSRHRCAGARLVSRRWATPPGAAIDGVFAANRDARGSGGKGRPPPSPDGCAPERINSRCTILPRRPCTSASTSSSNSSSNAWSFGISAARIRSDIDN
jgi:hypothetical protein